MCFYLRVHCFDRYPSIIHHRCDCVNPRNKRHPFGQRILTAWQSHFRFLLPNNPGCYVTKYDNFATRLINKDKRKVFLPIPGKDNVWGRCGHPFHSQDGGDHGSAGVRAEGPDLPLPLPHYCNPSCGRYGWPHSHPHTLNSSRGW